MHCSLAHFSLSVVDVLGGARPWSSGYAGYGMTMMAGKTGAMAIPVQRPVVQSDRESRVDVCVCVCVADTPDSPVEMSWDKEFQSQESLLNVSVPEALSEREGLQGGVPADDMARLAAQVIDSVKHEQNPKFQKSEFMNLMRQLRDGEVTVEEDDIVPKDVSTTRAVDVKGKGRAVTKDIDVDVASPPSSWSQPQVLPSYQGSKELNAAYVQQAKDPHEAYFRQENADFTEYWNAHYTGSGAHTVSPVQGSRAWHEMQRDWDAFEATTTGVTPVVNYQFQTDNPYLLGDSTRTRHHALHMSHSQRIYEVRTPVPDTGRTGLMFGFARFKNVLALEAAVQRDPTNAAAWFELGVKQQENEREAKAVQALRRAIDLDPSHLPTWLALAVSYTNDNHRLGTYDAIREWVLRNPQYEAIVSGTSLATDARGDFGGLIDVLLRMARDVDRREVDADVQVALAVLLNTTEVRFTLPKKKKKTEEP